jgi:hypothetical protein
LFPTPGSGHFRHKFKDRQEQRMQSLSRLGTACVFLVVSGPFQLHAQNPADNLQQKLNAEFSFTKITADRSDIVTAGSVLVLHRDGLLMYITDAPTPPLSVYREGRIQQNTGANLGRMLRGSLLHGSSGQNLADVQKRTFVSGEKFWLTGIDYLPDGVVFNVYSDPYNNVRYYGQIKFPFAKNAMPPADVMAQTITEVVTVQPSDNAAQGDSSAPAAPASPPVPGAPSAPASAADMAPIAPPPPPPDQPPAQPKTISIGQSKDDVTGILGQPAKDIKLGAKEILVYSDMKVTLLNGKVSDVE